VEEEVEKVALEALSGAMSFEDEMEKLEEKAEKYVDDHKTKIMRDRPEGTSEYKYEKLAKAYYFLVDASGVIVETLNGGSEEDKGSVLQMLQDPDDMPRQGADVLVRAGLFSGLAKVIVSDAKYKKLISSDPLPEDWKLDEDEDVFLGALGGAAKLLVVATRGEKLGNMDTAAGKGLYTTELIKSGLISIIVDLLADVSKERWGENGEELRSLLMIQLGLIAELTERSKEEVTKGGKIFPVLIGELKKIAEAADRGEEEFNENSSFALFLMMRLAQYAPAQSILNKNGVMEILQSLMKIVMDANADEFAKRVLLVAAASLGGDEFSKSFSCDESTIDEFVDLLKEAADPAYQAEALTLRDICGSVVALSVNEDNKKFLFDCDIVEPALSILRHKDCKTFHDAIKTDMASLIMNLSFDEDLKEKMEGDGIIDVLKEVKALKPSERFAVEEHDASDFAKAVDGALFNFGVREERKRVETAEGESEDGHIMISYNWSHKPLAQFLNKELKARGYKVWIDEEGMEGDAVEAMAGAVEGSNAVLWITTSAYKQSANCQLEAKYSNKLRKPIVPIMAEPGYKPDGWLGLLCGDKVYFNFREEEIWEESIDKLDKEIQKYRTGAPAVTGVPAGNQVAPAPAGTVEPHKKLSLSEKADAILNELAELRIAVQEIRANQCSCTVQ